MLFLKHTVGFIGTVLEAKDTEVSVEMEWKIKVMETQEHPCRLYHFLNFIPSGKERSEIDKVSSHWDENCNETSDQCFRQ